MRIQATVTLPTLYFDSDKCLPLPVNLEFCVYLYHDWDVDVDIDPWYQAKKISISWSGISVIIL